MLALRFEEYNTWGKQIEWQKLSIKSWVVKILKLKKFTSFLVELAAFKNDYKQNCKVSARFLIVGTFLFMCTESYQLKGLV